MTEYLEPEQAVLAAAHLGLYIRDEGLLFSALARPATSVFGNDAYATLELKAAALLSSVARNHALIDGNKRFAWYLTLAFFSTQWVSRGDVQRRGVRLGPRRCARHA
ncbi:MAG: Fic family protein [Galbitalea sp.]